LSANADSWLDIRRSLELRKGWHWRSGHDQSKYASTLVRNRSRRALRYWRLVAAE